ncbi:hypothetical protein ACFL6P_02475 [Candidatus Latescibacterota bacterium]
MFVILLYCLAVGAGIFFLLIVLPVKIIVQSAGGSDEALAVSGRIMIFAGLLGGGIAYRRDDMKLSVFLMSWKVFSFDVGSLVKYVSDKSKKKKAKKEPAVKEKAPLADRIRSYYDKWVEYKGHTGMALSDLYEIFRIDRFSAYVNFGFGNPALTGKLIGIIFIVNSVLPKPFEITQSWDFSKTTLNGELDTTITLFTHIFWAKLIKRMPLIIGLIREHRREKHYSDTTLAIQEV